VTIAIIAVVVVVVAVVFVAIALRVRQVRRDELLAARSADRRLVAPPPSPYEPSRGFRLLEPGESPGPRVPTPRPRIDPGRPYVFSDSLAEDVVPTSRRHSDEWFLSRSSHRSGLFVWTRRFVVLAVVGGIVAAIVLYYLHKGPGPTTHGLGLGDVRAVLGL
jgi:hypothetical protein